MTVLRNERSTAFAPMDNDSGNSEEDDAVVFGDEYSAEVAVQSEDTQSHDSDDVSESDSDDEGGDIAEELAVDGDDPSYDRNSVMKSFVTRLREAGATEADVETCLRPLPTTTPTLTPISMLLIAAYAAYWVLTGGFGLHSLVYAMVGYVPLRMGVMYIKQAVYCLHFPVDKKHMMGPGKETVWSMTNLVGRFVGWDNKIVQAVCCTGWFLALLMEHLPFGNLPIIDLHPFVNSARGGGFSKDKQAHCTALLAKIYLWLANGAFIFRIGSRGVVLGALSVFQSLKAEGSKYFDIYVDVGRHKVRLHVFTGIKRKDGTVTPVYLIGSQHLCMFRFPWIALYIIACEILLFCLLNVRLSTNNLKNLSRNVKNCGLTDEEQEERLELCLSEMEQEDRDAVQALRDNKGKTLQEAINSWRSWKTGHRCVRKGCHCINPLACICAKDHPNTQHGQLTGANSGFKYPNHEAAERAVVVLDNLSDKPDNISFELDAADALKVVCRLAFGRRIKLNTAEKLWVCDVVSKHAPSGKAAHGAQGMHYALAARKDKEVHTEKAAELKLAADMVGDEDQKKHLREQADLETEKALAAAERERLNILASQDKGKGGTESTWTGGAKVSGPNKKSVVSSELKKLGSEYTADWDDNICKLFKSNAACKAEDYAKLKVMVEERSKAVKFVGLNKSKMGTAPLNVKTMEKDPLYKAAVEAAAARTNKDPSDVKGGEIYYDVSKTGKYKGQGTTRELKSMGASNNKPAGGVCSTNLQGRIQIPAAGIEEVRPFTFLSNGNVTIPIRLTSKKTTSTRAFKLLEVLQALQNEEKTLTGVVYRSDTSLPKLECTVSRVSLKDVAKGVGISKDFLQKRRRWDEISFLWPGENSGDVETDYSAAVVAATETDVASTPMLPLPLHTEEDMNGADGRRRSLRARTPTYKMLAAAGSYDTLPRPPSGIATPPLSMQAFAHDVSSDEMQVVDDGTRNYGTPQQPKGWDTPAYDFADGSRRTDKQPSRENEGGGSANGSGAPASGKWRLSSTTSSEGEIGTPAQASINRPSAEGATPLASSCFPPGASAPQPWWSPQGGVPFGIDNSSFLMGCASPYGIGSYYTIVPPRLSASGGPELPPTGLFMSWPSKGYQQHRSHIEESVKSMFQPFTQSTAAAGSQFSPLEEERHGGQERACEGSLPASQDALKGGMDTSLLTGMVGVMGESGGLGTEEAHNGGIHECVDNMIAAQDAPGTAELPVDTRATAITCLEAVADEKTEVDVSSLKLQRGPDYVAPTPVETSDVEDVPKADEVKDDKADTAASTTAPYSGSGYATSHEDCMEEEPTHLAPRVESVHGPSLNPATQQQYAPAVQEQNGLLGQPVNGYQIESQMNTSADNMRGEYQGEGRTVQNANLNAFMEWPGGVPPLSTAAPRLVSQHVLHVNACRARGEKWSFEMQGRWFPEEVEYFQFILELFRDGLLRDVEPGLSFREFISELLQTPAMRVSKKFAGLSSIGLLRYPTKAQRCMDQAEAANTAAQLKRLEESYTAQRNINRPHKRQRTGDKPAAKLDPEGNPKKGEGDLTMIPAERDTEESIRQHGGKHAEKPSLTDPHMELRARERVRDLGGLNATVYDIDTKREMGFISDAVPVLDTYRSAFIVAHGIWKVQVTLGSFTRPLSIDRLVRVPS